MLIQQNDPETAKVIQSINELVKKKGLVLPPLGAPPSLDLLPQEVVDEEEFGTA